MDNKKEFLKIFEDELLFGESMFEITKEGIARHIPFGCSEYNKIIENK